MEPKPIASLTSGLLARKGAARPAMRRQNLGGLGAAVPNAPAHQLDDLGWNDMGYDVNPASDTPSAPRIDLKPIMHGAVAACGHDGSDDEVFAGEVEKPAVVVQQESLAARLNDHQADAPVHTPAAVETVNTPVEGDVPEPIATQPVVVPTAAPAPVRASAPRERARPGSKGKAAFTLRLDADRHMRLRLASALTHQSSQIILISLLDDYLAEFPQLDAMATKVPVKLAS